MAGDTTDVGEAVDRLTQMDIAGRGVIRTIREAAAEVNGPRAAMRAAERLHAAVEPGDPVVILTGFLIPPAMAPETDGPPGAATLARAVDAGLEATPIIACEGEAVEVCEAAVTAAGLSVLDREASLASGHTAAVESFPADRTAAADYASKLLELEPAAVIAVEKVGPNRAGRFHTMAGFDVTKHAAKVDCLFNALERHETEVVTIGVGDGGNEIGMGVIDEAVRAGIPYGDTCRCDCEAGIAAAITTDVLVPAAVSNWGAYGIVACLSALSGRQLLHTPDTERRTLEAVCEAGGIDGIRKGTSVSCDDLTIEIHESVVRLLRAIPTG